MKETRTSILQKSLILFLEKGYHGTSISDIQDRLDIGRATLYHHFTNKEDLFFALIDELFLSMGNEVQLETTSEMTIQDLVNHLRKKLFDEAEWLKNNTIGLIDFYILSAEALRLRADYYEVSDKLHEKAVAIWSQAIRNSIRKGEVKETIDVTQTAKLFVYVKHGIGFLSNRNNLENSIAETLSGYESIYILIKN